MATSIQDEFTFFWKSESPFSQWYKSMFTVDGITYNCAEQYMMHRKALLFEDERAAGIIMKEKSPRKQKALGRKVKNFDEILWNSQCQEIVKQGNMAKFSQNSGLLLELMSTRGTTLVEASPFDRIWGIGLTADSPGAWNKETWEGTNLLGYILTDVREQLTQEEEAGATGGLPQGVSLDDSQVVMPNVEGQQNSQGVISECELTAGTDSNGKRPGKAMKMNVSSALQHEHQIQSPTTRSRKQKGGQDNDQIINNSEGFTFFWGSTSPFSQWYRSTFTLDGITYNCAEQFMMHRKALLFGDDRTADIIMNEKSPKRQKALGRKVKNFNEILWNSQCQEIVRQGNMAKFSQNSALLAKLMSTRGTTLVEASPHDTIWGIGLTVDNPASWSKDTWEGTNLLGYILTDVREQLIQEEGADATGGIPQGVPLDDSRVEMPTTEGQNISPDVVSRFESETVTDTCSKGKRPEQTIEVDIPHNKQQEQQMPSPATRPKTRKDEPINNSGEFTFFWKSRSPFSQWYKSRFSLDGITYNCAEQYMMHRKALLCGDDRTADLIMKERNPQRQKSLGRKVKHYDENLWNSQCQEIVKQGNMAKFTQDSGLLAELISTRGTTLVEASPNDKKWGIGLSAENPAAWNKDTWDGSNLLGYILTDIREQLIRVQETDASQGSPGKGSEEFTFFWKFESPFSQWHNCTFTVDGITYNCAEQYMMQQKALLFGDDETAAMIMEEHKPQKQKALGRKVKKDQNLWNSWCQGVVKRGNIAKFSQNPHLLAKLMSTRGTTLVEASPHDKKWGIGLSADNPAARNRESWEGKNLLGYILTEVREQLYLQQEGVLTSDAHVEKTVEQTVEQTESVEQAVEQAVEQSMAPTVEKTVGPTVEPTVEQTVEPTVEPTVEQTVGPTVEQTVEPTVEKTESAEQTVEQAVDQVMAKTVEPTVEQTEYVAQAAEQNVVEAMAKTVEKTVERTGHGFGDTLVPDNKSEMISVVPISEHCDPGSDRDINTALDSEINEVQMNVELLTSEECTKEIDERHLSCNSNKSSSGTDEDKLETDTQQGQQGESQDHEH